MGENPFDTLATFLENLMSKEGTMLNRLDSMCAEGETYWDVHLRGVRYYDQVMRILETLGRTADIGFYMAPVRETLFFPADSWQNFPPTPTSPLILHSLHSLGNNRDIIQYIPARLDPEKLAALRETFVKIQEIVQGSKAISQQLAAYLIYLCQRGIDIIDGREVDLMALRSLTFEVTGLAGVAAEHLPEPDRQPFKDPIRNLWTAWAWDTSVNAGAALAGGIATKAIEAAAAVVTG